MELEGTKVATTDMLLTLAELAEKEGYERQLDAKTIERLDPNGKHIVCLRPEHLPDAPAVQWYGVTKLDLTMGTPLPCEILIKRKGTMKMVSVWLDIPLYAYNELTDIPEASRAKHRFAKDGQRRQRW